MDVDEIEERAADMFESANNLQRRAIALPDSDPRKADYVKEAHRLSHAACRLQANLPGPESQINETSNETTIPSRSDLLGITTYTRLPPIVAQTSKAIHPSEKNYKTDSKDYKDYLQKK